MKALDFRISVETVIRLGKKVLLTKRAKSCIIAPNKWCVPAGKLKLEETPEEASERETKEETGLKIKIIKQIGTRAFKRKDSKGKTTHRLVFTFLAIIKGKKKEPVLNNEHSCFEWVTKKQLKNKKFSSMQKELKAIINKNF